jgi:hypothetical protein
MGILRRKRTKQNKNKELLETPISPASRSVIYHPFRIPSIHPIFESIFEIHPSVSIHPSIHPSIDKKKIKNKKPIHPSIKNPIHNSIQFPARIHKSVDRNPKLGKKLQSRSREKKKHKVQGEKNKEKMTTLTTTTKKAVGGEEEGGGRTTSHLFLSSFLLRGCSFSFSFSLSSSHSPSSASSSFTGVFTPGVTFGIRVFPFLFSEFPFRLETGGRERREE